jgi:hypothetical protein
MRGDQLGRQWRIIGAMEASPNELTVAEIAKGEENAIRTIYQNLKALQTFWSPNLLSRIKTFSTRGGNSAVDGSAGKAARENRLPAPRKTRRVWKRIDFARKGLWRVWAGSIHKLTGPYFSGIDTSCRANP